MGDERARKEGAAAQKQYVQVRVGCVCVCVAALQFSREVAFVGWFTLV